MRQTPINIDDVLELALKTKLSMDELIKLGDSVYVCMECGVVTDYWKPGEVCPSCEYEGERQFEQERGN